MGIEPTTQAWEARILPLNYTRTHNLIIQQLLQKTRAPNRRPCINSIYTSHQYLMLLNLF